MKENFRRVSEELEQKGGVVEGLKKEIGGLVKEIGGLREKIEGGKIKSEKTERGGVKEEEVKEEEKIDK